MEKGKDVFIGEYSIVARNVHIGDGTKIWNFCKIYGCRIGQYTEIGSYYEIKNQSRIGDHCILKSYVSVSQGTRIGNRVFIGPRVIFLNDRFPSVRAVQEKTWNLEASIVEDEVTIGGGSITLPGVRISRGAFIGAGSVVTKDIPSNEIWVGNPARYMRKI